jgi:oligoribonuclease NrnB/cAMP/cGMP phosphodiesterase (DHH superfamily)
MGSVLCFFHHPCNDGSGAAAALEYRLRLAGVVRDPDDLRLCPMAYTTDWDEPLPEGYVQGDVAPDRPVSSIYMVDITFSRVKFDQIVTHLRNERLLAQDPPEMVCIDHHRSALERIDELREFCDDVLIEIGPGLSGSTLVWEYFNRKYEALPVPLLLQYIADQDIWEWRLENSREINASLNVYEGKIEKVREELELSLQDESQWKRDHCTAGRAILDMVDAVVAKTAWQAVDIAAGAVTLRVLNSPSYTSELGNELCESSDEAPNAVAIVYSIQRDWSVRCSIRSIDGGALNARQFAERFGGGGHDHAAGCRFRDFDEMKRAVEEFQTGGK